METKGSKEIEVGGYIIPAQHEWSAGELIYKVVRRAIAFRFPNQDHKIDTLWEKLDPKEQQCWEEAAFVLLTSKDQNVTSPLW